jgi:spoIIIJ-associated protein
MTEKANGASRDQAAAKAKEVLEGIIRRMGIDGDVSVVEEEERLRLEIECDRPDVVVGRRGQVLDALQHLVGKIVFRGRSLGEDGAPSKPIVVDADGYRDRHAERLRSLAVRMADKAIESRKIVALDPMSAHDRRIMHLALADKAGVSTRSEGEGEDRHMLIVPTESE